MSKRVVLHCGANKTGTTATQVACFQGRALLLSQDVFYPDLNVDGVLARSHWPLALAFSDRPDKYYAMADRAFDLDRARAYTGSVLAAFDQQILEHPSKTVLISSEAIGRMPDGAMARFVSYLEDRFDQIEAVFFARDPTKGALSFLQEHLKAGHETRARHLLGRANMNFAESAKTLSRHLGRRINFRLYDRSTLYQGDILAEILCPVVGLPAVPAVMPRPKANESISAAGAAFLYFINRNVPRRGPGGLHPLYQQAQRYLRQTMAQTPGAAKLAFPTEHWPAAVRRHACKDWLGYLEHAGFPEDATAFRARLAEDTEKRLGISAPDDTEVEAWMRGNLSGFPTDDLPEDLAKALKAGLEGKSIDVAPDRQSLQSLEQSGQRD